MKVGGLVSFQTAGGLLGRWVLPNLLCAVDWVRKGSYHTALGGSFGSRVPFVAVRARHSYARTVKRRWALLAGKIVELLSTPLMTPWCAEGEVPTAANLNLHRGRNSCVRWHCDDEPLFGDGGCEAHCFGELRYPGALQMEGKYCLDSEPARAALSW